MNRKPILRYLNFKHTLQRDFSSSRPLLTPSKDPLGPTNIRILAKQLRKIRESQELREKLETRKKELSSKMSDRTRKPGNGNTEANPIDDESKQNNDDWSATQYLKFSSQRTRPIHDLIAFLTPLLKSQNPRIYDLGCGPGNSTSALLSAYPSANITGLDSSPSMLQKARTTHPQIPFIHTDLTTFRIPPSDARNVDLLFSNAVFHWLRSPTRIKTLVSLFTSLSPGAVLAIQVPDNYHEPSHRAMRETALSDQFAPHFAQTPVGDLANQKRPDLDPIEPPQVFYNALQPLAASVDVWRTEYMHVLQDAGAIVEWVKGTGLQPYLQLLDEETQREFLEAYEQRLGEAYGGPERGLEDGKVLLGYPRLFVVAVRGAS